MKQPIVDGVYWIGVIDWTLTPLLGHELSPHRGSTDNPSRGVDEKTVLVDTAWALSPRSSSSRCR